MMAAKMTMKTISLRRAPPFSFRRFLALRVFMINLVERNGRTRLSRPALYEGALLYRVPVTAWRLIASGDGYVIAAAAVHCAEPYAKGAALFRRHQQCGLCQWPRVRPISAIR